MSPHGSIDVCFFFHKKKILTSSALGLLFIAITMFCHADIIMQNIPHIQSECGEYSIGLTVFCEIFLTFCLNVKIFCRILSVPQNIVMALNNIMV